MQNAKCRMQNETIMGENVISEKSFAFSVRIVNLYKYLKSEEKEYILAKQLLRSGTSIGANVSEAQRGQSKADFAAKMCIALKEANETEYWLRLLYATGFLNKVQFESMNADISELISLLAAICKTSTEK